MKKALVVIDIQNDYVTGSYPQFNVEAVIDNNLQLIKRANAANVAVILVQHEAVSGNFLAQGSDGVELHPSLLPFIKGDNVIKKSHANSFLDTDLTNYLMAHGIDTLYLTGFMTQNCITHTALSKQAESYHIIVIAEACSAPTQRIHQIALTALKDSVEVKTIEAISF